MAELVNTFCSSRCCKDFSAPDALAPASSLGCVINTSVVESTSSIKYCWTPFVLGHALYMMLSLCCNYGAALHAFADDQATASYLEGGNGGGASAAAHVQDAQQSHALSHLQFSIHASMCNRRNTSSKCSTDQRHRWPGYRLQLQHWDAPELV